MQRVHGIERICITDRMSGSRVRLATAAAPYADEFYYNSFRRIGRPLVSRKTRTHKCQLGSPIADFDQVMGIDLVLNLRNGERMKVQEKLLSFSGGCTMTFEEQKNSGKPGGWYYCKAELYSCLYCLNWRKNEVPFVHDGMIVNLSCMRTANINWKFRQNSTEGCRQKFRYVEFNDVPECCIVYRWSPLLMS